MKKLNKTFVSLLRDYLTVYLPKQKNSSPHTILSTQQTWNMLLRHVCDTTNKRLDTISFEDLNRATVTDFLDKMAEMKGWSPSTRNQRLGRIRSFFKYAASLEPLLFIYQENLKGISLRKSPDKSRTFAFMIPEAMNAVFRQPDISTRLGVRDLFFMVLMWDTAARASEMLELRLGDIDVKKHTVLLLGKGAKQRVVPISADTVKHFQKYQKLFHPSSDKTAPLFYTVIHRKMTQMSHDNVTRFLRKYGDMAKKECPDVPEKIHPHMVRRSRAMALYRSGMPLPLLSQWLGHERMETSLVYAHADTSMVKIAIEKTEINGLMRPSVEVSAWDGDEEMIKKLLGLA